MMPNTEVTVILLFFPSLLSLFYLGSAYHSVYNIRKSKTAIKKLKKSMKLWQKFFLLYPFDPKSPYYKKVIILRKCYYSAWLILLLCTFLLVLAIIFPPLTKALFCCVIFKFIVFDVPIGIFGFIMTKHGKNGGVVWGWEE